MFRACPHNGLFALWLRWNAFLFQSSTATVHFFHKNTFRLAREQKSSLCEQALEPVHFEKVLARMV
jgi:hypothetical protein